jgi:uncharacterized protein YjdB
VVSPATQVLASGAVTTLTATVFDAKGRTLEGRVVTWGSSDAALATVTGPGQVTAGLNRGGSDAEVTVTASSEGRSGSATLTVIPVPAARVVLSVDSLVTQPGGSAAVAVVVQDATGAALSGRSVTWVSLDTTIARVAATGQVTIPSYAGPATRTTSVIATVEGLADTAKVIVLPLAVARVVLTPDSLSLRAGTTQPLTATVQDAAGNTLTGRTITWSSSDSSVVTVSSAGILTATSYTGPDSRSARVVALVTGAADTAAVVVTPIPVGQIDVTPESLALLPGDTTSLAAAVTDSAGLPLTGRTIT